MPRGAVQEMIQQIAKYLMENWRELVWPAVLFAAVVVLGSVVRGVLFARLRRRAASTPTRIDNILVDVFHGPFLLWIMILAIHLATQYSALPRGITRWSGKLLLALWIVSLTLVLARLSVRLVRSHFGRLDADL